MTLVTYYNFDVKEGTPDPAITGTFNTIKGIEDVANGQSEPVLSFVSLTAAKGSLETARMRVFSR